MSNRGFSERTYEFCFNAEFCERHNGLLAALPILPSQRQEKYLGYDVSFKIENGNYCYSLFLQHKIPSYASNRVFNNRSFYDTHNGPYFRFKVDKEQHNRMIEQGSIGNIFYCGPLFYTYQDLEDNYKAKSIVNSSIWIDPNNTTIIDNINHNITYDPLGTVAYLHSDPRLIKTIKSEDFRSVLIKRKVDLNYIRNLANDLSKLLIDTPYERLFPNDPEDDLKDNVARIQNILGRVFDISWILI